MARAILVTGGAGFIGTALVRALVAAGDRVTVLDKLTYAANRASLDAVKDHPGFRLVVGDICDAPLVRRVLAETKPDAIMHLAAESHVDRSLDDPQAFIETNVVGTYVLLQEALAYWRGLPPREGGAFRFHHVSTDEVYGAAGADEITAEDAPYRPNSPYSAAKASSDHLVRAWHRSFNLPVVTSIASNNYGPYQFPEKFIPLFIINGLEGKPLPVYGDGSQQRDWLHVDDHAAALLRVVAHGRIGECYNIGGSAVRRNIDVARAICAAMDRLHPQGAPHERLIASVADRPGHDIRYALDSGKVARELDWRPQRTFEAGLAETIVWYIDNRAWWEPLRRDRYGGERLGLAS